MTDEERLAEIEAAISQIATSGEEIQTRNGRIKRSSLGALRAAEQELRQRIANKNNYSGGCKPFVYMGGE